MGMYTELYLGIDLKPETPPRVIEILKAMIDLTAENMTDLPEHPFFKTERWHWCLKSGGSYYFDAQPHCLFEYDDITKGWHLTFGTNIKNYTREWESFVDWIAPWINEEDGHIGHYRYEEDDMPTLLYARKGVVHWLALPSLDALDRHPCDPQPLKEQSK